MLKSIYKFLGLYSSTYILKSIYKFLGLYEYIPLDMLTKKELKEIINGCKRYCSVNLGVNNNKKCKLNVVVTEKNTSDDVIYGDYLHHNNQITLYSDTIETLGNFTSTFIHEYTHSLQPSYSKYLKMLKVYGYDNHPFEIEARENEVIHNNNLLSELFENY